MLRLISNHERSKHLQHLQGWLSDCTDGFIAVAFFKHTGFRSIEAALNGFLQRGGTLRLLVGTDFYLTEPSVLRALAQLAQQFPKLNWRMVEASSTATFHPKYYRFCDPKYVRLISGSANLTAGGLEKNIEVSIMLKEAAEGELTAETARIEAALWTDPRCQEVTEERIGTYATEFEIARKHQKEAGAKIRKELEEAPKLDGKQLRRELEAYFASAKDQADLKRRRANYRTASELIQSDLLKTRKLSAQGFESIYQRLVGQSGRDKLWHSGSVYRSKTKVLDQWPEVVAMVQDIASDLRRSPEAMYAMGRRWIDEIGGLGPNIFTEFCHTLAPKRYAPLNNNPVTSLRCLRIDEFPHPSAFQPADYARFCHCLDRVRKQCGFANLGETDHFLNFVYWRHQAGGKKLGKLRHENH
jgi:HKD family nuclease